MSATGRLGRWAAVLVAAALVLAACGSADADDELASDDEPASDEPVAARERPVVPPTSTTTSVPPGGRQPTADDPLRVLFAGDSIGIEVAAPAIAALGGGGSAIGYFVANPSIPRDPARRGLWERRLAESNPEVIVLLVGVWERMGFGQAKLEGQTVGEYRAEVIDPFVDLVTSKGAQVVWVSAPLVEDPTAAGQISFLDQAFRSVGETDDRVDYIDAAEAVAGPDGEFIEVVTGPDGFSERVRRIDGTHLCPGGAVRMAQPVIRVIVDRWNLPVDPGWPNGDWRYVVPFEDGAAECPAVG